MASFARSTLPASARRPREGLKRHYLSANAKASHARSGRAPQVRMRSASLTTYTSASYHRSYSRRTFGKKLVDASAGTRREAAASAAVDQIAPVRNEIAHVREIDRDRLLRASVACADVLEMLQGRT